jgi:uncharacterized protein YjbI with pentapeptide repeats
MAAIPSRESRVVLEGVRLEGLDLSGAFLDGVTLRDSTVADCVLEKAHCRDFGMVRCRVLDTSFRDANLRESVLAIWAKDGKGSEFTRVDFTKADFRECVPITSWFTDCDFSGARLDQVRFKLPGLIRCRFSGVLYETQFDGRVFDDDEGKPNVAEDVDMTAAVLRYVGFRGFDLDAVKLPAEPGLRVVRNYLCVLKAAEVILRSREGEAARLLRILLKDKGRALERGRSLGLFNGADFVRLEGEELAELAEDVIIRAERACAATES